jgi:hypothetical protein
MSENTETTVVENSEVIVAKRSRGRPRLEVTAFDRARDAFVATGSSDTATLIAAATAIGIKKSSAAVYLHTARKNGLVPVAQAPASE